MVDSTNRLEGARATFGSKKPVAAASTGNITTLSGFQTIDGVSFSSTSHNLRVLLKDQTAAEQNGIYDQASSAWTRTKDFDGNTDLIKGTPVWVADGGTLNGGKAFAVVSDNPPDVGVDDLTFDEWPRRPRLENYTVAAAPSASAMGAGSLAYISNGAAGSPVLAFSNGTNWLRSDTLATISAT